MTQPSPGTDVSFRLEDISPRENKSFNEGGQFVWDSTSLTLAQTCPRKYQYRMIEGWQSRGKSFHLLFGGHFATALEHYYKHRALGMTLDEALEEVVFEALCDTWDQETGQPWNSGDNLKTRETLIRTIIWYVDQFANDAIKTILLADGRPAVEYSFTLPIDNGYFFAGHLDRLCDYSGGIYVMDQKTTKSTVTSYYFEGFNPDIQMSMYTFAGKAIFHLPVKGVIIDAAQIAVGFTRFERGFTFRTEEQLNEWYEEMLDLIERIRGYVARGYFPMNRTACGNYGGCEFRGVCSRAVAVRPNFLAADFVRGPTWDPLERR